MNKGEKNLDLNLQKKELVSQKKKTGGVHSKGGAAAANLTKKKAGSVF
jgi:hypothetical protein